VKELNLAIIDLGTLSESVDGFATWWGDMETVLKSAAHDVSRLQPGKNIQRVKQLQKCWSGIKEDHKQYKSKVCSYLVVESIFRGFNPLQIIQLQDHYMTPS